TPSDFPLAHLTQQQLDDLNLGRRAASIYPLSPLQQGLLFQTLYEPESGDYVIQTGYTFQGDLNIDAFKYAWQQLAEHHTILRTAFVWKGLTEPLQIVQRSVEIPFELLDWSDYSQAEQQERLLAYQQIDRSRGFDLSIAPLMRLTLVLLNDNTYQFLWSYHHIILDGWSVPIVLRDVFSCYQALCRGEQSQLEYVRPYQEYIRWLSQQDLNQAEAFWREQLAGFTTPNALANKPQANDQTESQVRLYGEQYLQLSEATTQALQDLARRHHLTLNTLMQGAWALLVSRYSGQDDVVFGVTMAGRTAEIAGIEEMVGLFINTLPLRIHVEAGASLLSWLEEVQQQQQKINQYEYSPLVQVQNWSEVPRGVSLFESLLVFENYPLRPLTQEEEGQTPLRLLGSSSLEQSNYPLSLIVLPGTSLGCKILYDRGRFSNQMIEDMTRHLQTLLEAVAQQPEQPVATLSLLTASEREQLLHRWNPRPQEPQEPCCIHQLFEDQVQRAPDAIALAFED